MKELLQTLVLICMAVHVGTGRKSLFNVHPAKVNVLDGRVEESPLKLEVNDFDKSSTSILNDVNGLRLNFSCFGKAFYL